MWDMKTGRSRGYGFVAFRDRGDAEKALSSMDGEWLGSRAIRCNWANQKGQPSISQQQAMASMGMSPATPFSGGGHHSFPSQGVQSYEMVVNQTPAWQTTCYVGNLTPYTTQNDLVPLFQNFGFVVETRFQSDRGFAFIKMDTHENAAMAICQLSGYNVNGRPLKCSVSDRNSYRISRANALLVGQGSPTNRPVRWLLPAGTEHSRLHRPESDRLRVSPVRGGPDVSTSWADGTARQPDGRPRWSNAARWSNVARRPDGISSWAYGSWQHDGSPARQHDSRRPTNRPNVRVRPRPARPSLRRTGSGWSRLQPTRGVSFGRIPRLRGNADARERWRIWAGERRWRLGWTVRVWSWWARQRWQPGRLPRLLGRPCAFAYLRSSRLRKVSSIFDLLAT